MKTSKSLILVTAFGLFGIGCEMHPLPSVPEKQEAQPAPQPAESPSAASPAPRFFPETGN